MRGYCLGLLMPIERKSVDVGNAPSSDTAMLAKVGELVLSAIRRHGPIEAWIIFMTGSKATIPNQGTRQS
jgi:hypothetical protein